MFYKNALERLRLIKSLVKTHFLSFGVNKKQELTRLIYEISKREAISPVGVIRNLKLSDYKGIKKHLLERRYPLASSYGERLRPYLPGIEFKATQILDIKEKKFYPRNIFIERGASNTHLAKRFKSLFPNTAFKEIDSLKSHLRFKTDRIEDYNRRQDTVFIVNELYDFFKACPCTKNAFSCGYQIFNLGFGCIFECDYCFLQEYTNLNGIILPANIETFFSRFNRRKKKNLRLGTGEFTDSLALDGLTQYSLPISEFFGRNKEITIELKTKSTAVDNLLSIKPSRNIVISWSLNPQNIIDADERLAPSLKKRLDSASKCASAGYRVGFHFDPLIYFKGWQKEYEGLIEDLFNKVKLKDIAWISIGSLRFSPQLKKVIEKRFPENKILDGELLLGYDNKLRYPYSLRRGMYGHIINTLRKHSRKLKLYLCMEELSVWKELKLKMPLLV